MAQTCSKRAAFTRRAMPAASRRASSSSHSDWRNSTWPSSPAPAWASRASRVSSMPERRATSAVSSRTGASSLSRRLVARWSNRLSGPCRWAGTSGAAGSGSPSFSVPATKMPLTVLYSGSPISMARRHAASRRSAPYLSARRSTPWAWREPVEGMGLQEALHQRLDVLSERSGLLAAPLRRAHEEGHLLGREVGPVGLLALVDLGPGLDDLGVDVELDGALCRCGRRRVGR